MELERGRHSPGSSGSYAATNKEEEERCYPVAFALAISKEKERLSLSAATKE